MHPDVVRDVGFFMPDQLKSTNKQKGQFQEMSSIYEALKESDIAFLCLPDSAAIEAVQMAKELDTVIIDTSTAHRTNDDWTYGFPEIKNLRDKIKNSEEEIDNNEEIKKQLRTEASKKKVDDTEIPLKHKLEVLKNKFEDRVIKRAKAEEDDSKKKEGN